MSAKTKRGKKDLNDVRITMSLDGCVYEFFEELHGRVMKAAFQAALERGPENGRCYVGEEDILIAARSLLPEAAQELENILHRSKTTHVQRRAS